MASTESLQELDENIRISMNICRGVVQRYIAHILGQDDIFLEPIQSSHVVGFSFQNGDKKFIKLDLVDWKTYKFDLGKWNCKAIRQTMATVINNLKPVFEYVINNDSKSQILENSPVLKKEFNVVPDPHTNIFIFNPSKNPIENKTNLTHMHDNFALRIGFVWTGEDLGPPPNPLS